MAISRFFNLLKIPLVRKEHELIKRRYIYFPFDSVYVLDREMMTVSSGEKMIAGCDWPLGRIANAPN